MSSFPREEVPRPDPLFYAMEHGAEHHDDQNTGEIRAWRRPLSLPLLTVPILGVQTVWSTEMAFGKSENCELWGGAAS